MPFYDSLEVYDVTCPPSTPVSAPVEVHTYAGGDATVVGVILVIPDGHSGLTGISFGYGHTPVYPRNPGSFISGNDEVLPILMANNPAGVPWSVFLCNNDIQPHIWQTRWQLLGPQPSNSNAPLVNLPTSAIYAANAAALAG